MTAPLAPMLTPDQAAARLGLSVDDLEQVRRDGTGPRHSRFDTQTVRYSPAALCEWRHHQQRPEHRTRR
ncbi:hypothetical protein [Solicola sp. PLA-1-18]|uniref:hypothetical protein n=1 Tax=Solicola sp. PLA-1-18 TaxID=3380532 RepID=UPI003B7EF0A9